MSDQKIPKLDFTTFVLSVSSAAFMGLGLTPRPGSKESKIDLELARHNIDLLELISQKTKGNLSADESKLLESLLYETRMRFVDVQKKVSTK